MWFLGICLFSAAFDLDEKSLFDTGWKQRLGLSLPLELALQALLLSYEGSRSQVTCLVYDKAQYFSSFFIYLQKSFFFQELVYTNIHTRQKAPQVRSCEYGGNPTPPLVTGVVDEKFRDSRAHVKIRPYCPVRIPVIHFWYFSIFSTSDLQRPKQSEFYHKANVRQCTRGIWTTGKT